ncbi:YceI family protein [Phytoactinopolyspora limicola]|uniref:YceI family protein n=1 Tax=Phytoactinopolyspora limicola TaxID=2715536 RepID=UPI00140CB857|nr:YceI family protein [Phytoactinopolyspora limicola]
MTKPSRLKRRLLIAAGAVVGAVALVLGGTWIYINVFSGDAPDPFSLDPDGPTAESDGELATLDGTWSVGPDSEAGYRVDEVLNGLDNTVVGRTTDVSGEIVVESGVATSGEVVLDMTTVTTDSNSRDGQFRGPIMNTDEYPTATFTLAEPVSVAEVHDAPAPVTLTADGQLTLRDVTRDVRAELQMQRSGDTVQVAGSIPITFTDFDVEPPNLAFVRVEGDGLVEFLITFIQE